MIIVMYESKMGKNKLAAIYTYDLATCINFS